MTGVIKVHEVEYGHKYRLFPNNKRSRYLEVVPVGLANGKVVFEHYDPDTKTIQQITDVDLFENVIRTA